MIVGGKLSRIEVERGTEKVKSINVRIGINDIQIKNQNIEISYSYNVKYLDNAGEIKITGVLYAKEGKKLINQIKKGWNPNKDKRTLPADYSAMLINAINYAGMANGTVTAKLLDLPPPLVSPQVTLKPRKK